jgi:hypothetical protein
MVKEILGISVTFTLFINVSAHPKAEEEIN